MIFFKKSLAKTFTAICAPALVSMLGLVCLSSCKPEDGQSGVLVGEQATNVSMKVTQQNNSFALAFGPGGAKITSFTELSLSQSMADRIVAAPTERRFFPLAKTGFHSYVTFKLALDGGNVCSPAYAQAPLRQPLMVSCSVNGNASPTTVAGTAVGTAATEIMIPSTALKATIERPSGPSGPSAWTFNTAAQSVPSDAPPNIAVQFQAIKTNLNIISILSYVDASMSVYYEILDLNKETEAKAAVDDEVKLKSIVIPISLYLKNHDGKVYKLGRVDLTSEFKEYVFPKTSTP